MRIAVVGSGISGLAAAWLLSREHQVTLFEQNDRLGGHSNTLDVELDGVCHPVDTGFIVFNRRPTRIFAVCSRIWAWTSRTAK